MENGQRVPEPIPVGLSCGMTSLQVIHTDLKGNFQFVLGAGAQGNMDMSASSDSPMPWGLGGLSSAGGLGGSGNALLGCELRVSVPGYQPVTKTITDPGDIGGVDTGTLILRRNAGVGGSAISVTSLLVPDSARKEFDKGEKEVRNNHPALATQHLEKAVAEYDKYAAAWNELGKIYSTDHEMEKAHQAFAKAITSDPQYIPPYMSLAALEMQDEEYESAVETAGKALRLDPTIGFASFIQAVANLKLNRLDAAEKSGLAAEREPHENTPQVHVLLAEIFLRKQSPSKAADELRAYLKESPQGKFAGESKEKLGEIEKSAADADGKSSPPPQTTP